MIVSAPSTGIEWKKWYVSPLDFWVCRDLSCSPKRTVEVSMDFHRPSLRAVEIWALATAVTPDAFSCSQHFQPSCLVVCRLPRGKEPTPCSS